jgi:hypothetical protein
VKNADGGSPNRCLADEIDAAPSEMVLPTVAPGMEELGQHAAPRVYAGQICALMQVTVNAGQRQIVESVSAAMGFRNDVLDMEWRQGRIVLTKTTILATVTRAPANAGSGRGVHRLRFGTS